MTLKEIKRAETHIAKQAYGVLQNCHPTFEFIFTEDDFNRSEYGLGVNGVCFANSCHFMNFKLDAGLQNGAQMQTLTFTPLREYNFQPYYDGMATKIREGKDGFDLVEMQKCLAVHELVGLGNQVFLEGLKKHKVTCGFVNSYEFAKYEEHRKQGFQHGETPFKDSWNLILDFKRSSTPRKLENFTQALAEIVLTLENAEFVDRYAHLVCGLGVFSEVMRPNQF